MDGFLVERLTPEEDEKFREHLLGCLYCSAFLSNFNNTRKASRFYGIPAGPELDPYMEEIHLSPLPKKLAKLSRELLRRLLESNPKIESIH